MKNSTAKKLKQIPEGYLIVGVDPHKKKHAAVAMTGDALVHCKFKVVNSRRGYEELLERAPEVDEGEDRRYGKGKRGDELPRELAFRESRLRKIREAKASVEAEAREAAERAKVQGKEPACGGPEDRAQHSFTDPESRIMPAPGSKHFVQGYNAQAAVDSAHQVIVAADVTNRPSDNGQVDPMMEQVRHNTGQLPREVSADAGYFSAKAVTEVTELGVEAFMPPHKVRHTAPLSLAPRGRIPKDLSLIERRHRKLRTQRGKKRYALRSETLLRPGNGGNGR